MSVLCSVVIKSKNKIRSNIINYYNRADDCLIVHNQITWSYATNNARIVLTSPVSKHFDALNYCNSFFRKSNISLRKKAGIFTRFFTTQWTRVAFRGKSYRIKCFRRLKKFTFNFGYSHWSKFIANQNWIFNRRRRQSYLVFTFNLRDMQFFKRQLPYVRFYNCYTMRGLRLKKQPIIRRFGKISQHISILH